MTPFPQDECMQWTSNRGYHYLAKKGIPRGQWDGHCWESEFTDRSQAVLLFIPPMSVN